MSQSSQNNLLLRQSWALTALQMFIELGIRLAHHVWGLPDWSPVGRRWLCTRHRFKIDLPANKIEALSDR
jgi:hypothetical protein